MSMCRAEVCLYVHTHTRPRHKHLSAEVDVHTYVRTSVNVRGPGILTSVIGRSSRLKCHEHTELTEIPG